MGRCQQPPSNRAEDGGNREAASADLHEEHRAEVRAGHRGRAVARVVLGRMLCFRRLMQTGTMRFRFWKLRERLPH